MRHEEEQDDDDDEGKEEKDCWFCLNINECCDVEGFHIYIYIFRFIFSRRWKCISENIFACLRKFGVFKWYNCIVFCRNKLPRLTMIKCMFTQIVESKWGSHTHTAYIVYNWAWMGSHFEWSLSLSHIHSKFVCWNLIMHAKESLSHTSAYLTIALFIPSKCNIDNFLTFRSHLNLSLWIKHSHIANRENGDGGCRKWDHGIDLLRIPKA